MNQIEDYRLIADLLKDAYLPRMARVRQNFPRPQVKDVEGRVRELIARDDISALVKPGMEIAVTCGSRGINHNAVMARAIVDFVKSKGAEPYIVAAMAALPPRASSRSSRTTASLMKPWAAL